MQTSAAKGPPMHTALPWVDYLADAISSLARPEHVPILCLASVTSRGRVLGTLLQRFLAMTEPAFHRPT